MLQFLNIRKYADFRNATIRKLDVNNSVEPTILRGRIDFRNAVISEAHFEDIIFEKDADFSDVKFSSPMKDEKFAVVFRFINFESDAYFIRTYFSGDTAFERVNFKKDANFADAIFGGKKNGDKEKFSLSYINAKNLLIKWNQLPNLDSWVSESKDRIKSFVDIEEEKEREEKKRLAVVRTRAEDEARLEALSKVLKGLEADFRSRNQLNDANNAYHCRKRAQLKEARNRLKGASNRHQLWSSFQKELEWIFWGTPCGYGTKIWWIIGWSALFNFIFTIIYSVKGQLKRETPLAKKREFVFKQRLSDLPKEYLTKSSPSEIKHKSVRKFVDALRFSSVVLFKIGYRDTIVSGKILGLDYKYIVWIEWALGFYLLACIVVTLSNTLPIVNRLITGVF